MTKIGKEIIICSNCNQTSEQLIVYSINYALGQKEDNDRLVTHLQKCPHCGYENQDIRQKKDI